MVKEGADARKLRTIPKRNLVILALLASAATVMAAASYQYSAQVADEIAAIAAEDIQSNARIQAHDLSRVLLSKVEAINNNLRVISATEAFYAADGAPATAQAKQILSGVQSTTRDLTDFYMWLDRSGRLVWISDIDDATYEQYRGEDLSYRPYYAEPATSHSIYYSTAIVSNDGVPRMYVSAPILENGEFRGVVVAAVRLEVLGEFLKAQLSPEFQSDVGMMDRKGVILYSDDLSAIGKDVFGGEFQSRLPEGLKPTFNAFLSRSLSGGAGAEDITFDGQTGTLAYQTVSVDGKDFAVVYVVAQHNFAGSVVSLIDQQRNMSTAVVVAVGAVAVAIALLVISWNRNLERMVDVRTAELSRAVSSLQQANDQLKAHDRMQQEFINIAAHELRTPIQPLIGIAGLLDEEIKSGKDTVVIGRQEVEMIMRNARRLLSLSSDVLEVSRIESNSMKLRKEQVDLRSMIDTIVADMRSAIPEGKAVAMEFESRVQSGTPVVAEVDRARLFEVLSNLIGNAVKFTQAGGLIKVTLDLDAQNGGQGAVVRVSDTGNGIDSAMMPRLFTKFATNSDTGTGLGLFISKSIVEAHGGRIWAENNADGAGATFTFTLPLAGQPPA